jgi:putative dehydrogenase
VTRVALITPGALGTTVGKTLACAGHDILCCLSERSEATRQRGAEAGFVICRSLREAVLESEIVLSLVPPTQAVGVSCQFAQFLEDNRGGGDISCSRIYVDGNSISPRTAGVVLQAVSRDGAGAVKASFFGPASSLGKDNVVVLSGKSAMEVAALFESQVEVRVIGDEFNAASAVKMSMSILTKTLPALFIEAMSAAAAGGQLDVMLDLFERLYPGIMNFLRRTLPTYENHAARRLDEMLEIETWLRHLGQDASMTRSGRRTMERFRLADKDAKTFRHLVVESVVGFHEPAMGESGAPPPPA